jgi:hypothetical protein
MTVHLTHSAQISLGPIRVPVILVLPEMVKLARIIMSVYQKRIHATKMPTVIILQAALVVHVATDSLGMALVVVI